MEPDDSLPCSQKPRDWYISYDKLIQSTPSHLTSLRSVLILSSHLRQGIPNSLFPFGFPTKTLYEFLICPMRAECPAPLNFLYFNKLIA
jgi:hypothetical protein